jgi:glycosyltransferase involved in cell wall biosynthesis
MSCNKHKNRVAAILEDARFGGPQTYVAHLLPGLSEAFDSLFIFSKENSAHLVELCSKKGVHFKTVRLSHISKQLLMAIRFILCFPFEIMRLRSLFKHQLIDLVYSAGGSWQYKGLLAGRLAGVKVIWHLNDSYMPSPIRLVFALLSRLPHGFVFASERTKNYYRPLIRGAKRPSAVIPAPVDVDSFNPGRSYSGEDELKERLTGKVVIGITANVNPVKGLDLLIEIASKVNQQHSNLVFVVVGRVFESQAKYNQKIEQLVQERSVNNIYFVGGRSDLRPILDLIDIYVCTSRFESSPISVWEALAMANPVVAFDVGDVPLYVQDNVNGKVIKSYDLDAFATAISLLVNDTELRVQWGEAGRGIAVDNLATKQCVNKHQDIFNLVMANEKK